MTQEQFLEILRQAALLKTQYRHNWTDGERRESVADHSWRIALMAMLLTHEKEFETIDMNRVIRMCLIHDLGESFLGDIPTFLKNHKDEEKEDNVFLSWINTFDEPIREEWLSLLDEMSKLETEEAKTYKALDKLEAVISHNEADIDTWLPLEYDLQLSYGKENVQFNAYLRQLKDVIDQWTIQKIEEKH